MARLHLGGMEGEVFLNFVPPPPSPPWKLFISYNFPVLVWALSHNTYQNTDLLPSSLLPSLPSSLPPSLRSDVALIVRQTSLHVWKVVVTNTARTLREILPTLVHLLLGCLASQSPDKCKVAARTLGDLVRKLGERVLPEVIPMLEEGLGSESMQERQGVCIGLSEIIQQTSRDNVLLYMESLLPTVRNALCDQQPEVRAAAAMTFDSLHSTVGKLGGGCLSRPSGNVSSQVLVCWTMS